MSIPVHKTRAPGWWETGRILEIARQAQVVTVATLQADEEDTVPSEIVFGGDDEDTQDVADGGA